jgi:hypothetical protein
MRWRSDASASTPSSKSRYSRASATKPRLLPPPAAEPNASAIIVRSWASSAFATVQPLLILETTLRTGTRTSVRKVSQNGDEPLISLIGFTETPGDSMSKSRNEIPSCFLAFGSVRTRQNIQSARSA